MCTDCHRIYSGSMPPLHPGWSGPRFVVGRDMEQARGPHPILCASWHMAPGDADSIEASARIQTNPIVRAQLDDMRNNYLSRNGTSWTPKSVPASVRAMATGGVIRPHGRDAAYSNVQGEQFALLARMLQDYLATNAFLSRCPSNVPRVLTCPKNFHRNQRQV